MKLLYGLNTPCLVVDYNILLKNIKAMSKFSKKSGVALRPHFKTHKCVEIAGLQIKHGALGITCATIDEAEALVQGGIKSILIANQLTDENKIKRLLKLQKRNNEIIIAVENEDNLLLLNSLAKKAGKKINVLVEVDTGMGRLGREPGADTLAFTLKVLSCKNMDFLGLMGYEGHTVFISGRKDRVKEAGRSLGLLTGTAKLLQGSGIPVKIVSAGGTGTYDIAGKFPGVTEMQAGSYVFMDEKYKKIIKGFNCSLFLLSTVCGVRKDGYFILDAGRKAVSSENGEPLVNGTPAEKLNEEHSKVRCSALQGRIVAGQKVLMTLTHCCTTVNLHDKLYVIKGNKGALRWKVHRCRL